MVLDGNWRELEEIREIVGTTSGESKPVNIDQGSSTRCSK